MSETNKLKIIPFKQFTKPIKDAAEIVKIVKESYLSAQHNKKIAKILMERIATANLAISLLQDDDLHTTTHYTNLQGLIQVLQKMKKYTGEITQYSTLLKFLKTKTIESQFSELCQEYDASVDSLSLSLMVNFKANAERDSEILEEEIENLSKFQEAILENTNTSDMSKIIDQVGEISITMQNLENEEGEKKVIQKKIESIFTESPLPFDEYVATNFIRGKDEDGKVKIRKYESVKGKTAFAFGTVDKEIIEKVKIQVAILKKIVHQNVIRFYGYTIESDDKYYLITDWAEEGSLYKYIQERGQNIEIEQRLKFACDIAKGLNFLNSAKILHRDIKSENIVIIDQCAKITNFKLSRGFEGATANLAVTKESVRHSSPETLRRGMAGPKDKKKLYDTKSEVYGFGILLWEIAECRTPYSQFEDFMEVTNSVINGYREPLTPDTGIPEKYQNLVNEAVDQNPGNRPLFAKILVDLQDIVKNYTPSGQPTIRSDSDRPPLPDAQKVDIDNETFNTSIDEVVDKHHNAAKTKEKVELSKCYKLFNAYANMGNPKAKYWKAYYITKGWSDLPPSSKKENNRIATDLFKEAADYSDEFSEAQLRYALSIMSQNREEAIEYLLKAAKNGHAVAMFNVATFYFSSGNKELGRYYMIMAANKKYPEAVNYCKENKIPSKYT